ncbi:hypothetical protein MPH_03895 [Macrophomina phaseolina MS6]|uniref:Cystinosin/ERS1p repeat protein n=1 Tax=Macrophomina phaseolina (strain MS6) TaxID=1126212 RepID=K2S902_MACPH|nr:hypothetical protein MPH_03895 [Macrophomina phaseolina MS6]
MASSCRGPSGENVDTFMQHHHFSDNLLCRSNLLYSPDALVRRFLAGHTSDHAGGIHIEWRPHRPYWNFLLYFTGALVVFHFLLRNTSLFTSYTSALGFVGLAIEACLPLPQILVNQKAKSTKGFRPSVLLNWLIGDTFKLTFFFLSPEGEVPWAFKLCGLFQACCDAYLGVQWWMFGTGAKGHEKTEDIPL